MTVVILIAVSGHRIAFTHTKVLAVNDGPCFVNIGILSKFPEAQGMLLLGTICSRKESCGPQDEQG
jgi:hypothetical protein